MTDTAKITSVVRLTAFGAALMMAFQVAGKAARDALFLSSFRPSQLPPMIVAGALTAILLGVINGRLLARVSPRRFVPWLLMTSAALHVVEYISWHGHPGLTAIAVYIHVVSLGAVITSGFWSVVNEQFDPYTAKQRFGTIAAAGTAGGVGGGFLAERLAVMAPTESVLLLLAAAQFITTALLSWMPAASVRSRRERVHALDLLRKSSWLRTLSLLVLSGTFSAALFDYVLKADARHALGPGEPLLRFFALFHTSTAALSFLFQTAGTSAVLSRFGLGATVATLPVTATVSGLLAAFGRTFPLVTAARGAEAVIRGSFYRAGYELLYSPMPAVEKRAIKSVNDVTVDRLGDALGGAVAQMAITLGPSSGFVMLLTGSVTSGIGWLLARRLQKGYVRMLEHSLQYHASEEEAARPDSEPAGIASDGDPVARAASPDETPDLRSALMSGDPGFQRQVLQKPGPIERGLLPLVIPLLANPELRKPARQAIASIAPANVGQLSDYLLDPQTDTEARMQLPSLLAATGVPRAAGGLLLALMDPDRRIRRESARALEQLKQITDAAMDEDRVYPAVRDELHASAARAERADLGYLFTLLSLVLPSEPVRVASESLRAGDPHLRGLALEYLETAVPADVAALLMDAIEERPKLEVGAA